MNKSELSKRFKPGTAEYVVMHHLWQKSRNRNSSAAFSWQPDPRKALAWAKKYAYFPETKTGAYLDGKVPEDYKCCECGAVGCKLWRDYGSYSSLELVCCVCAAREQKKNIKDIDADGMRSTGGRSRTDQIGWYLPAVPYEDGGGFWAYTSVPSLGCEWWRKLPTKPFNYVNRMEHCQKAGEEIFNLLGLQGIAISECYVPVKDDPNDCEIIIVLDKSEEGNDHNLPSENKGFKISYEYSADSIQFAEKAA